MANRPTSTATEGFRSWLLINQLQPAMNPFVNSRPALEQIESTPSSQDGISPELETLLRSQGTRLIQACGILLKLFPPVLHPSNI